MSDPQVLIAEIDNQMKRLSDVAVVDYKRELVQNMYPLMRMAAECVAEHSQRLDLAENAIAEALINTDSAILPDLSAAIHMALALGVSLCEQVVALGVELPDDLRATIDAYRKAADRVAQAVSDVTLEATDLDDIPDMGEDEDEDDEESDEDEAPDAVDRALSDAARSAGE